jgi:hypothetical protein
MRRVLAADATFLKISLLLEKLVLAPWLPEAPEALMIAKQKGRSRAVNMADSTVSATFTLTPTVASNRSSKSFKSSKKNC